MAAAKAMEIGFGQYWRQPQLSFGINYPHAF